MFNLNKNPNVYIKDHLITHAFHYAMTDSDIQLNVTVLERPQNPKKTLADIDAIEKHIFELSNNLLILKQELTSKYNL